MNAHVDLAPVFGDPGRSRGCSKGWDFLGNLPVPLRQRVRDGVADLLAGRDDLKCCLPMGQGGRGPLERLRHIRAYDDFPAMLVSAEHGNAFNRRFHKAYVETGCFSSCQPEDVDIRFAELLDPMGWVGVFATAPFVMLVDKTRLGGLPLPRRWADLLEPDYRGQVVFSGWKPPGAGAFRQVNLFLLLCLAQMFGLKRLEAFLANVPTLLHSTQMPRIAGGGASVGGVYILPWSLATMCPRRAETEVIWPEDGALAYPLWLTVKHDQRRRLEPLVDHFHGAALAEYLNRNRYPALCPGLDAGLPEGAKLTWPGWEMIRHPATAELIKTIRRLAQEALPCG